MEGNRQIETVIALGDEKMFGRKKKKEPLPWYRARNYKGNWPAPGSEDTELGVLMEREVGHGEAEVYTRVQA